MTLTAADLTFWWSVMRTRLVGCWLRAWNLQAARDELLMDTLIMAYRAFPGQGGDVSVKRSGSAFCASSSFTFLSMTSKCLAQMAALVAKV